MSDELKTTSAAPADKLDTQPEANGTQSGGDGERKFTQDEVNKIVKERLQRERSKAGSEQQQTDAARAAELTAKENRLTCKEYLLDNGYPQALLDAVDTSDPEQFKSKAETLMQAMMRGAQRCQATPQFEAETPPTDGIAEAFSKPVKHKPKGAY